MSTSEVTNDRHMPSDLGTAGSPSSIDPGASERAMALIQALCRHELGLNERFYILTDEPMDKAFHRADEHLPRWRRWVSSGAVGTFREVDFADLFYLIKKHTNTSLPLKLWLTDEGDPHTRWTASKLPTWGKLADIVVKHGRLPTVLPTCLLGTRCVPAGVFHVIRDMVVRQRSDRVDTRIAPSSPIVRSIRWGPAQFVRDVSIQLGIDPPRTAWMRLLDLSLLLVGLAVLSAIGAFLKWSFDSPPQELTLLAASLFLLGVTVNLTTRLLAVHTSLFDMTTFKEYCRWLAVRLSPVFVDPVPNFCDATSRWLVESDHDENSKPCD